MVIACRYVIAISELFEAGYKQKGVMCMMKIFLTTVSFTAMIALPWGYENYRTVTPSFLYSYYLRGEINFHV